MKIQTSQICFLLILSTFTIARGCEKFNSEECCVKCDPIYFLYKCSCYQKEEYYEFFVKMNPYLYMLLFIAIPSAVLSLGYILGRYGKRQGLLSASKLERRGPPVIFDDSEQGIETETIVEEETLNEKYSTQNSIEMQGDNLGAPLNW